MLPGAETGLRLGSLRAERAAIQAAMPAEPDFRPVSTMQRQDLRDHLDELRTGTGRYTDTLTGQAAQTPRRRRARDPTRRYTMPNVESSAGWQRRKANGLVDQCRVEVDQAREVWRSTGGPIEQDLTVQLEELDERPSHSSASSEPNARPGYSNTPPLSIASRRSTTKPDASSSMIGLITPDEAVLRTPAPTRRGPGLSI